MVHIQEIEQQKRYMLNARGLTASEKDVVLEKLSNANIDTGIFGWVKCPVWRLRMYKIAERNIVETATLNKVMRYILEGEII